MNLMEYSYVRERILEIIKAKGPSLPVHLARTLQVQPLFISAFLSEMFGDQKVLMSSLKVGSSSLYYFQGQEAQLENFVQHLNQREREAFELLKKFRFLEDSAQEPVVRVALRALKDFAFPVSMNIRGESKLFWRFYSVPEEELINSFNKPASKFQNVVRKNQPEKKVENVSIDELATEKIKEEKEENILPVKKVKKEKIEGDSQFLNKIKKILGERKIEIVEIFSEKKKELHAKVSADGLFGKQEFYFVAKDKKKVQEDDIAAVLQKAQAERMPAFFIANGDIHKDAKEYLEKWGNLIRLENAEF